MSKMKTLWILGDFYTPRITGDETLGRYSVYVPRGEFHTYKNIGSSVGRLLVVITPPQFEKFFEEIGIPVDEKSSFRPPQITPGDIENVVKTAAKYGITVKV